ncbi:MAG: hypothetical protein V7607_5593 [Solirubrobacteraceae bacterium]
MITRAVPKQATVDYLRCQRHILLDMHVPDFDPGFLRCFDPAANVELYAQSGADAVMVYCNSHVGLSYHPTETGAMHPGLDGRDVVGETVDLLHARGMAACAYYSVNFNNWAHERNPSWGLELPGRWTGPFGEDSRCRVCCPANPDYRRFARAQVAEIAAGYEFDAFFFDMVFWPGVCVCVSCRERYRDETGRELPAVVDWRSPDWCDFQSARERWLLEQFTDLADEVKERRSIPVFSNLGGIFGNWQTGLSLPLAVGNDVLGGDVMFSSGAPSAFAQLTSRLSASVWQYMHSATDYVSGAAGVKSLDEQRAHALMATAVGGQFMAIDAVLPDGRVHGATYDRLAEVFAATKPFEPFLGGHPVVDVAVYYSHDANVSFADNGMAIEDLAIEPFAPSEHAQAVFGACAALQRAHLPAGVITRADLGDLDAFAVVVLPNVLRMDDDELAAFRGYVERGGRLYASGFTSLVSTEGVEHVDFALADVFGCHFEDVDASAVSFVRPVSEDLGAAIAPAELMPHGVLNANLAAGSGTTTLLVDAEEGAVALATLTRPFELGRGTRGDRAWASIWGAPPWQDTDRPVIVEHAFGEGRVLYAACDIESAAADSVAAQQLFTAMVRRLLDRPPAFEADAHPHVWVLAFHEPEERRIRLNLLNHQVVSPALPVPSVAVRLRAPEAGSFTALRRLPTGEAHPFEVGDDGILHVEVRDLQHFDMLAAEYTEVSET